MKKAKTLSLAGIVIMVSAWCAGVSAQQNFQTGQDLLAACRVLASGTSTAQGDSFHIGVCLGEIGALNWLAPGVEDENIRSCIPENVAATQMADVIVHYLDHNPDRLSEPFQGLALEALAQTWPCQRRRGCLATWLDW